MSSPAETVLRTLASASLLAFLLALGEGARLLQGSGPGPGELLALVSAGVTTLLPALLCAGLLLGLLLAAAGWTMDLLHVVPGLLRLAVRTPAPRWLGASAGAGAALAAGLAVFQAALGERLGRPNPQDAGLAVACAAVALPAAALLAGTLVASLARRLLGAQGERPWARVAIPLLLLAGGGAVALHVAIRLRPILESIDWRLPLALLLLGASWPILFTILVRAPAWLRLGLRWTAPFSLGALAAFGFFALDTAPAARASLAADRGLLPQLLVRAQALLDHDGDGYSRLLGGGDCDDRDALVHPGGDEVAGNGRDEDCDGEDLPLASTVALAPASPSTTPPGAA
ncbi:MAG: hypothetical protein FJ125_01065, partial [Deltaproteobacteria bacterium]|nr:hypothetical protein [Deltaproteobacteria bacterium]